MAREIRLVILVTEKEYDALCKVTALMQETMGSVLRELVRDGVRYRAKHSHYPPKYEAVMWEVLEMMEVQEDER